MGFLVGKTALITGGTRGIGRACAEALLAEGANVVINGRSADKGAKTIEELGGGDRLHFAAGDVTQRETCFALVDETISHFGQIDILVNNAGGTAGSALLWEMEEQDWHNVLNWNLNHPMWTAKRAIPNMIERGWGRIINISSIYGKMSLPTVSHYVTTKHGLNGLTKALAAETAPYGIRVNAICPGFTRTDIFESEGPVTAAAMGMTFDDWVTAVTQISMTKTVNEPSQVGATCAFLCSAAGEGITGSLINVDGGSSPY
jgi:3-hydroxybutyrate dehydrogenase